MPGAEGSRGGERLAAPPSAVTGAWQLAVRASSGRAMRAGGDARHAHEVPKPVQLALTTDSNTGHIATVQTREVQASAEHGRAAAAAAAAAVDLLSHGLSHLQLDHRPLSSPSIRSSPPSYTRCPRSALCCAHAALCFSGRSCPTPSLASVSFARSHLSLLAVVMLLSRGLNRVLLVAHTSSSQLSSSAPVSELTVVSPSYLCRAAAVCGAAAASPLSPLSPSATCRAERRKPQPPGLPHHQHTHRHPSTPQRYRAHSRDLHTHSS